MHPILEALHVDVPAHTEAEYVARLRRDSFLALKIQDLIFEKFGAEAVGRMLSLEIAATARRIGLGPKAQVFAAWSLWDTTLDSNDRHRFSLKAVCASCKNTIFVQAPRPWVEEIALPGNRGVQEKVHQVTRADVERILDNTRWKHCGSIDRPDEHLMLAWSQRLY